MFGGKKPPKPRDDENDEEEESQLESHESYQSPTTRNRGVFKRNYSSLEKFGLQGPPGAVDASPPTTPSRKNKKKKHTSQAIPDSQASQASQSYDVDSAIESQVETNADKREEEKNTRKQSWIWKYYDIKMLDTTCTAKGSKKEVREEEYKCKSYNTCGYRKLKSTLCGSTTNLSTHLKEKHRITKDTNSDTAFGAPPSALAQWVKPQQEELPSFDEALVDWIVESNQAFTVVESDNFKRMLKAAGCTEKILSASTIAKRIQDRVSKIESENRELLDRTATTVSLSMDGWC